MPSDNGMMTFGGHLEVLRKMLLRILAAVLACAAIIFAFKDETFAILLSPSEWDFCTYRWTERFVRLFNPNFGFDKFQIDLIATDLSSQFMTHITTAIYLGILCATPFIIYELFRFVSPALLKEERKHSVEIVCTVYLLFILGVLMSYYVLFPISFRFLGTYSVADKVHSTITLDSYISTFVTLTLLMGFTFQLPVIAFVMAKIGVINVNVLVRHRKYAFLIICLIAAIITPPDVMTLILVALPLYALYEVSIRIVKFVQKNGKYDKSFVTTM